MSTESIVGIIVSSITAFAAILALIISIVQISKSNKQSLFDRRLNIYLNVKRMKSLCDEHVQIKDNYIEESERGPIHAIDYFFGWMTNCTFLEEIQPSISHVLEGEYHRKYLLKIEELRNMIEEACLVFPNGVGNHLADFVYYYQEMLVSIYKYQIAIDRISKECKDVQKTFPSDNQLEISCRQAMVKNIKNTFELSDRLFQQGIFQKAKESIKY